MPTGRRAGGMTAPHRLAAILADVLQGGAEEYASTAPWIAIFPGLAIALTCSASASSATPCVTPSTPNCATAELGYQRTFPST